MEDSNLDDKDFNPKEYFNNLWKTNNLKQLVELNLNLQSEIKSYDKDIQNLVFENYSKFITSIDTVKNMRESIEKLENKFNTLNKSVNNINDLAFKIEDCLGPKREKIKNLNKVNQDLSNLKMLYEFPNVIKEDLLRFKENFTNTQELEKSKKLISKMLEFFPKKTIEYYKVIESKLENLKDEDLIKPIYIESKQLLKDISLKLNLVFFSKNINISDFVLIYQNLIQIDNDKNRLTKSFFKIYKEKIMIKLKKIFDKNTDPINFIVIDSKFDKVDELNKLIKNKLTFNNDFLKKLKLFFDNLNIQFDLLKDEMLLKNINKNGEIKNFFDKTLSDLILKIEELFYEKLLNYKNGFYIFSIISNSLLNFVLKNNKEIYNNIKEKYLDTFKLFGVSYFINEYSNLIINNGDIFESKIDSTIKEKINPLYIILNERCNYLNHIFNFLFEIFSQNLDFDINLNLFYKKIYKDSILCLIKGKYNLPKEYSNLLIYESFYIINNQNEILIGLIFLYKFILKKEKIWDEEKSLFYNSIFINCINNYQKLLRTNFDNFDIENKEKNLNNVFEIYKIIKSSLFLSSALNDLYKNIISKDFIFNNQNKDSHRIWSKQTKLVDNDLNENSLLSSFMRMFLRILIDILRKNKINNFFEQIIPLIQLIYEISDKNEENIIIGFAFEMLENNKILNRDYIPLKEELNEFKTKYNII